MGCGRGGEAGKRIVEGRASRIFASGLTSGSSLSLCLLYLLEDYRGTYIENK